MDKGRDAGKGVVSSADNELMTLEMQIQIIKDLPIQFGGLLPW